MDAFTKKTHKTSRGYTYTYYFSPGENAALPALLFQHGWPDNAAMWKDVAGPLISLKFPIIIPDMLGYDGTDKPTDPAEYRWDKMTRDLMDIADAEGIEKVVSIGHDWGSACASRVYQYFPSRVVGLVNLNVAYMAPGRTPWDLAALNEGTEKAFGYPFFSYWDVFAAEDGAALLGANVERVYNAMHGEKDTMKTLFCGKGVMREYLKTGKPEVSNLRPYAQGEAFKKEFVDRMTRDGFESPQCWYRATTKGIQAESDKNLPSEVDKVNVPALYIGATDDAVCRPEAAIPAIQGGLLPDYKQTELIDASHWVPYEKPGEIVERLKPWLEEKFLAKSSKV